MGIPPLTVGRTVSIEEARELLKPQKKSKYRAIRCELDEYTFDSKAEMARYCDLARMQMAKEIRDLVVHPVYPLIVCGQKVCDYEADFTYVDAAGKQKVEDVKGGKATMTPLSRLKHKLFHALYPHLRIEIVEVR